jgi:uncharacterized protein (DUF4415 family)
MKKASPQYVLKNGRVVSNRDLEIMSEKIEHEQFDLSHINRLRGRPRLGTDPSVIVPVRLDADLVDELDLRVHDSGQTRSEVIRLALKKYLASSSKG